MTTGVLPLKSLRVMVWPENSFSLKSGAGFGEKVADRVSVEVGTWLAAKRAAPTPVIKSAPNTINSILPVLMGFPLMYVH